jgi:hypothetical protein
MTQIPDPVELWRGLMAALMQQSGLSARRLAARAGYSRTYCNEVTNGTRVPPWPVAEAIITVLGDDAEDRLPAWCAARQALGMSTDTGRDADDGPPAPPPGASSRDQAEVPPATPVPGDPRPVPAPEPAAPAAGLPTQPVARARRWFRLPRIVIPASVAVCVVISALSYLAVAVLPAGHRHSAAAVSSRPGRTPGQSQPADPPCRTTRQYLVISDGAVLNAHGTPLGDGIHRGDYFDLAPEQPHNPYTHRYYGSVVGRDLSGYVDQARIRLTGTVCLPPHH